jgi:GDP-L-fucose synthase
MEKTSKIYVAGHRGMVGSAILRLLQHENYLNLVYRTHEELDLMNSDAVSAFFEKEQPEYVFLAAAKVGGILANNMYPAEFIYKNITIQSNIIHNAYIYSVKKLLFLGSSCIYPKLCPQPIKEEYLLSDYLEPTNEAYAVAKIAGIKMCQSYNKQYGTCFISAMPTNLFGINDNFHPEDSHVVAALIGRIHEAKQQNQKHVVIWGSGNPLREFLYVEDLAAACVFLMEEYSDQMQINVGTGKEVTIREFAEIIRDVIGANVEFRFDLTKPDGTPRKVLDVSRINALGWKAGTSLKAGLEEVYKWYCKTITSDQQPLH